MSASKDVWPDAAKLEALAEFAAGAGHEINNPVATIVGRVQLLLQDEADPERRQALKIIGGQAYRIRDMIGDVMLFARPPLPQPQDCDVTEAIHSVLSQLRDEAECRGVNFELNLEEGVTIWADPTQLSVVVSSLVRNSLEAIQDGESIRITSRSVSAQHPECAFLSVSDRGAGLSEIEREHLFDPFFSGRQAGRGLGFGLPKCWRIVTNHGGWIEAEAPPEGGTTLNVHWPVQEPAARQN